MTYLADIAEAVWTAPTRTLASGTPSAPTNYLEEIAEAVWTATTRELTGDPPVTDDLTVNDLDLAPLELGNPTFGVISGLTINTLDFAALELDNPIVGTPPPGAAILTVNNFDFAPLDIGRPTLSVISDLTINDFDLAPLELGKPVVNPPVDTDDAGDLCGQARQLNGDGHIRWALPNGNPIQTTDTLRISFWWHPIEDGSGDVILALNNNDPDDAINITQVQSGSNFFPRVTVRSGATDLCVHDCAAVATRRAYTTAGTPSRVQSWRLVVIQIAINDGNIEIGSRHNGLAGTTTTSHSGSLTELPVNIRNLFIGAASSSDKTTRGSFEIADIVLGTGLWGDDAADFATLPADSYDAGFGGFARYGQTLRPAYGAGLAYCDNFIRMSNGPEEIGVTATVTGTRFRMLGPPIGGRYPGQCAFVIGDTQRFTSSDRYADETAYEDLADIICSHVYGNRCHIWHVGDFLHLPNDADERDRLRAFMERLRDQMYGNPHDIPFIFSLGNHDFNGVGSQTYHDNNAGIRRLWAILGTQFDPVETPPALSRDEDIIGQPGLVGTFEYPGSPEAKDVDRCAEWTAHFVVELNGELWNVFALTNDLWKEPMDWVIAQMNASPYSEYRTIIITHFTVIPVNLTNQASGVWDSTVTGNWRANYQRLANETNNLRMTFGGHVTASPPLLNIVDPMAETSNPKIPYPGVPFLPNITVNNQEAYGAGDGFARMLVFNGTDVHVMTFTLYTGYEVFGGDDDGSGISLNGTIHQPSLTWPPVGADDDAGARFRFRFRLIR